MTTLEEYLSSEIAEGKIDFHIRAAKDPNGMTYFYIHPQGKNGRTADYTISGNKLVYITQELKGVRTS